MGFLLLVGGIIMTILFVLFWLVLCLAAVPLEECLLAWVVLDFYLGLFQSLRLRASLSSDCYLGFGGMIRLILILICKALTQWERWRLFLAIPKTYAFLGHILMLVESEGQTNLFTTLERAWKFRFMIRKFIWYLWFGFSFLILSIYRCYRMPVGRVFWEGLNVGWILHCNSFRIRILRNLNCTLGIYIGRDGVLVFAAGAFFAV